MCIYTYRCIYTLCMLYAKYVHITYMSMYVCIYIYIYSFVYMYVCMHIYIYTYDVLRSAVVTRQVRQS